MTGILITAAEQGKLRQIECQMPTCLCPKEMGGPIYFIKTDPPLSPWAPNMDHIGPRRI